MQSRPLSTVLFGPPGSGKSTVLNMLAGMPGFFTRSGPTIKITNNVGPAFGIQGQPMLKVFDAPGVGDYNLPLAAIVADIKCSIGSDQPIDATLIVLKSTDFRKTLEATLTIKCTSKFLKTFESRKVFMVITHCDQEMPDEEFIEGKLQSYLKYG